MKNLDHLTPKKLKQLTYRIWRLSSALKGISGLFQFQSEDSNLTAEELVGIGQLLELISNELSTIEDILNCGYDSSSHVFYKK